MPKLLTALILLLLTGCAKYEYDVTRPENLAMHVGRETERKETPSPG